MKHPTPTAQPPCLMRNTCRLPHSLLRQPYTNTGPTLALFTHSSPNHAVPVLAPVAFTFPTGCPSRAWSAATVPLGAQPPLALQLLTAMRSCLSSMPHVVQEHAPLMEVGLHHNAPRSVRGLPRKAVFCASLAQPHRVSLLQLLMPMRWLHCLAIVDGPGAFGVLPARNVGGTGYVRDISGKLSRGRRVGWGHEKRSLASIA